MSSDAILAPAPKACRRRGSLRLLGVGMAISGVMLGSLAAPTFVLAQSDGPGSEVLSNNAMCPIQPVSGQTFHAHVVQLGMSETYLPTVDGKNIECIGRTSLDECSDQVFSRFASGDEDFLKDDYLEDAGVCILEYRHTTQAQLDALDEGGSTGGRTEQAAADPSAMNPQSTPPVDNSAAPASEPTPAPAADTPQPPDEAASHPPNSPGSDTFDRARVIEVTVCNRSSLPISVAQALSWGDSDRWVIRGWLNLAAGQCAVDGYTDHNHVYFYAISTDRTKIWQGSSNFCIKDARSIFHLY